jgi:hypothetical protein
MKKLQLGPEFFIAAFLALICSVTLLFIINQEEKVDAACAAIETFDNASMVMYAEEVLNVDMVGTRKETMLMVACKTGNYDAIAYLLSRGADINKTARGSMTPLELFCRDGFRGGEEALILIVNSGLRQSNYTEKPAIFFLADNFYWMSKKEKALATEQAIILLKAGAPMGYMDTTLLHLAAKADMADLFYTMVHTTQGLSLLTMKDGDGLTPWGVASRYGAVEVQKVIRNLEQEYQEEQNKGDGGTQQPSDPFDPLKPSTPTDPTRPTDSEINSNT